MKTRKLSVLLLLALTFARRVCLPQRPRQRHAGACKAKQLPDVVRVITGRFERNPPLYFQMRASRVLPKNCKLHPERLPLCTTTSPSPATA